MPAFLTHYTCGVMGYRSLPQGKLKTILKEHMPVYSMGLAGPDLFFYSVGELAMKKEPIGRIMHKYRTGAFLHALWDEVQALEETGKADGNYETALAYFCGFLGHYCLDTRAHALVYKICDHPDSHVALGKHFRYEAAMDAMCCEKLLGRSITRSRQMGLVHLKGRDIRVIAKILSAAIDRTYGKETPAPSPRRMKLILREYYLITGLIFDPSGFREYIFEKVERIFPGYPYASPLCINNNRYGLGEKDWDRFYVRFRKGVKALRRLLGIISEELEADGHPDAKAVDRAGSWSYHGMHLAEAASERPLEELIGHPLHR